MTMNKVFKISLFVYLLTFGLTVISEEIREGVLRTPDERFKNLLRDVDEIGEDIDPYSVL